MVSIVDEDLSSSTLDSVYALHNHANMFVYSHLWCRLCCCKCCANKTQHLQQHSLHHKWLYTNMYTIKYTELGIERRGDSSRYPLEKNESMQQKL